MNFDFEDTEFYTYVKYHGLSYASFNITQFTYDDLYQDLFLECEFLMANKTHSLQKSNLTFCPPVYDGYYCWAPATTDSKPSRSCPSDSSDPSQLAYRYCDGRGVWDNKTNYNLCIRSPFVLQAIYLTGFSLSFISLLVSLVIFLYFKSLRCLRNHIHSNLIISFLIRTLAYFVTYAFTFISVFSENIGLHNAICNILHFITSFAMLANHIWMVMEGLYLFLIILCTFSIEKLKFWHFGLMGWGLSGLLAAIYCIVMVAHHPDTCWNVKTNNPIQWILNGPIIGTLVVNTLFLIFILYSLVIKVKASQRYRPTATPTTTGEATLATEYRKALKAMLVLFPLLGIYYILFLIPPHQSPKLMKIYAYINALILSTQGFFVALIYCFLNSEVRSVIRTYFSNLGQNRSLFRNRQCSLGTGITTNNRRNSRSANYFLSADHRSHSLASARSAHSINGTHDALLSSGRRQHRDSDENQQQETSLSLVVPDKANGLSPCSDELPM